MSYKRTYPSGAEKRKRKKDKNDKIMVCLSNVTFVGILFQIG